MKSLNEKFTNEEYDLLLKAKGKRTWREALLEMSRKELGLVQCVMCEYQAGGTEEHPELFCSEEPNVEILDPFQHIECTAFEASEDSEKYFKSHTEEDYLASLPTKG